MDPAFHDESNVPISCEEIVKTSNVMKKRTKKSKIPNPKWLGYLISCLDKGQHDHMLSYVPGSNEKEFSVVFIDRKNKNKWKEKDISLFQDIDNYIGKVFNRERPEEKFEEDVKVRFKANMFRCVKKGLLEQIGEKKMQKYKTVKYYRILWRPPHVSEGSSNAGSGGGNNGNSKRKSYKKKNNEETSLSRRNIQGKTANPENFPEMGKRENMNFESIPEMSKHENMNFEIIPDTGKHENMNFASIPEMGRRENMNFASIPEMGRRENMNFESIPEMGRHENMNFERIPEVGRHENMNFESIPEMRKNENMNFESIPEMGKNENMNFKSITQSKMYFEDVRQEDSRVAIQHAFNEMQMKVSHYLCLSSNSEINIAESECLNFEINLGNLETSYPVKDFDLNIDSNIFDVNVDDPVKIFCENSDVSTNISDQSMREADLNVINENGIENQGNEHISNNGKYVAEEQEYLKEIGCVSLDSDPFMCSGPFEIGFSPLGESSDWSSVYQQL